MAVLTGSASSSNKRKIFLLAAVQFIAAFFMYSATRNILLTALIMGGIFFVALAYFWPWTLTLVVFFLLYSNTVAIAVQFHNVPYIVGVLFIGLLVIPLAKIVIIDREEVIFNRTFLLMLIFVSIQGVGAIFASRPDLAVDKIITFLVEGIGLYFLVLNIVRTPRMLKLSIWAVVAAGLLMGAITFYQEVTHTYDNSYWGYAQWGTSFGTGQSNLLGDVVAPRLEGPIGDDNRFAQIMIVIAPLALFLAIGEKDAKLKVLPLIATFFIIVGALLTYSRGGLIALAVVIFLMIFFRLINLRYLSILFVLALLAPVAVPNFAGRLESLRNITLSGLLNQNAQSGIQSADSSVQSRATEMISSGLMFADFPLFGVGPGNYAVHYQEYAPRAGYDVKLANRQPHTLYGGIAAEDGIFGITCFLLILAVTLVELVNARREWLTKNFSLSSIATGLILGIIAYMVTGIFLHLSFIRFLFLLLGLAGAAGSIHRRGLYVDKKAAL
jgi:putative inorganic carbon (HCO3(-)) transporter